MTNETVFLGGQRVVGFGAPVVTNIPTSWIAVPVFGLPLAAAGAGVGYLIKRRHGAVVGAVVGGVVGGALGLWGSSGL